MIVQSDTGYAFPLPDDDAREIIATLGDDARERIQGAIDATEDGDPVVLPLPMFDTLLNAYAEWERTQS